MNGIKFAKTFAFEFPFSVVKEGQKVTDYFRNNAILRRQKSSYDWTKKT
jgi:hypothetical protein